MLVKKCEKRAKSATLKNDLNLIKNLNDFKSLSIEVSKCSYKPKADYLLLFNGT